MKYLKFYVILVFVLLSCEEDLDFSERDKRTHKKIGNELTFEGLSVNHRYKTPAGYIDDEKRAKEPLTSSFGGDVSLADFSMEDIAEATEKLFKNYPFPLIFIRYRATV